MLESLLKLLYGVDSLIMMAHKKTKFPAQALLAIATFLKTFHYALDSMDANMRDLPVVRPAKSTSTIQASPTSPQAPSPVVLPNRQVFLARVLRQAMVHGPLSTIASPMAMVHSATGARLRRPPRALHCCSRRRIFICWHCRLCACP